MGCIAVRVRPSVILELEPISQYASHRLGPRQKFDILCDRGKGITGLVTRKSGWGRIYIWFGLNKLQTHLQTVPSRNDVSTELRVVAKFREFADSM